MAILSDDSLFHGLSGKHGNVIFYQRYGKTIIGLAPAYQHQPTIKQISRQKLFADAVAYAKNILSDPQMKATYSQLAHKLKKVNAYQAAIAEYLMKNKGL